MHKSNYIYLARSYLWYTFLRAIGFFISYMLTYLLDTTIFLYYNIDALQVGENVGTIGYPFEQLSFSVGSIKQVNILRNTILGYVQTGMIQHDARGFHGSSGGPLLDLKGQVLGVNSYPGLQGYDIVTSSLDVTTVAITQNLLTYS